MVSKKRVNQQATREARKLFFVLPIAIVHRRAVVSPVRILHSFAKMVQMVFFIDIEDRNFK